MSDDLRTQAISNLKAKQHFWGLVVGWVALSVLFVVMWALSGLGYFWPVWPIVGIGIGVVAAGIRAFGPGSSGPSESRIQAEMDKLKGS